MIRLLISTGEVSGDLQGSLLVRALLSEAKIRSLSLEIVALGGPRMKEAGAKLIADKFLQFDTLVILCLGMVAFAIGTASGVLIAKVMNLFIKTPVNPLIGSAGVSAVPMAARVSPECLPAT